MFFIDAQRDILEDTKLRTSFFNKLVSQLNYGEKLDEIKKQIEELNNNAIENSEVLRHLKSELSKLNKTTQNQGEGVSINPFPKNIRDLHKGMKVYFQDNGSDTFSMDYHGMGTRSCAFTSWELNQIEKKIELGEANEINLLLLTFKKHFSASLNNSIAFSIFPIELK